MHATGGESGLRLSNRHGREGRRTCHLLFSKTWAGALLGRNADVIVQKGGDACLIS